MKALVQRVSQARVEVGGEIVGEIGVGLLVLLCAERGDGDALAGRLLAKLLKLRIFADADVAGLPQSASASCLDGGEGCEPANEEATKPRKMNRSVQDIGGGLLIVSQFTLAADVSGGNRPGFTQAALPEDGRRLYDQFVALARAAHPVVATGVFAADMQVHLVNDGPVTIPLQFS